MLRSFDDSRAVRRLADDRRRSQPSTGGLDDARTLLASGRAGHLVDALVELQRTGGNRRVQQVVASLGRPLGRPPLLQTKLMLGPVGDDHEREADRIARIVGDSGARLAQPASVHPMPAVDGGPVNERVRSAVGQARGGGQPVPDEARRSLERTLRADFSGVRLHTDGRAHELNHALQSRAFTVGHDVFFRRGDYDPGSPRGRRLLAHELTHVVQQGGAGTHPTHSPHGQVIQRELTDEARTVLEDANERQPYFTMLSGGDVLEYLDTNGLVSAEHVREVMSLADGTGPDLKSFVQALLLKSFAVRLMSKLPSDRDPTAQDVQQQVSAIVAMKRELLLAGYGATGGLTRDLFSIIKHLFGAAGMSTLEAYGMKPPAGDLRRLELCATYVPGADIKVLGRSHSFILYTNRTGAMSYVSVHANEEKVLTAEYGNWYPSTFGDERFKRETVAVGDVAEAAIGPLTAGADKINAAQLSYQTLTRNCNTAARYLLAEAGIERASGANRKTTAFGWTASLTADIEKKQPKEKIKESEVSSGGKKKKKPFSFWPSPAVRGPVPGSSSSATTTTSAASSSATSSSNSSMTTVRPRPRYGGLESAGLRRYYPNAPVRASLPTSTAAFIPTTSSTSSTSTPSPTPSPVVAPTGIVVTVTFPLSIGGKLILADSKVVVHGTDPTTGMVEVESPTYDIRGFVDADVLRESTTWYG